ERGPRWPRRSLVDVVGEARRLHRLHGVTGRRVVLEVQQQDLVRMRLEEVGDLGEALGRVDRAELAEAVAEVDLRLARGLGDLTADVGAGAGELRPERLLKLGVERRVDLRGVGVDARAAGDPIV